MGKGYLITGLLGIAVGASYTYCGFHPLVTIEQVGSTCYPIPKYQLKVSVGRINKKHLEYTAVAGKPAIGRVNPDSVFGEVYLQPSTEMIPSCTVTEFNNGQTGATTIGLMIPKKIDIMYFNPYTKKKRILQTVHNDNN